MPAPIQILKSFQNAEINQSFLRNLSRQILADTQI